MLGPDLLHLLKCLKLTPKIKIFFSLTDVGSGFVRRSFAFFSIVHVHLLLLILLLLPPFVLNRG